jgi:thymidylate synthase (FAD)
MVQLLDVFGDDLMVANVARVSYDKHSESFSKKDEKLLRFLAENEHTSPFRHPVLQFRVECPIYVERQIFKHFVGIQTNSISGRYVDFSHKLVPIQVWRKQSESSKQGSGENLAWYDNETCKDIQRRVFDVCTTAYEQLVNLGVSKEQARTILPLALETKYIWTGSLQAFIHLCKLRLKSDVQKETRDIVRLMLDEAVKCGKFDASLKCFKII